MSADRIVPKADRSRAVDNQFVVAPKTRERGFWIGLACAAVVHVALIVGVSRSSPRQMGEPTGSPDGISVLLVDEADLLSKITVPFPVDNLPGNPSVATPPPSVAAPPPSPDAERPTEPAPEQQKVASPNVPEVPNLFSLPDPAGKQSEADRATKDMPSEAEPAPKAKAKPQPQPQPQPKPQPQLDLSMPPTMFNAPVGGGGRSAAVARPPGATRSGENDEFGRGVIRALRQTMPRPTGVLGRVTIRLFLSEHGNLTEVRLVRSAGDANLDQSVVFAVKQSSFPIPPSGSKLDDRTFLVTYIYE